MTAVVKRSLEPSPAVPSIGSEYGWIVSRDELQIQWMIRNPVPDDVMQLISCHCNKSKCGSNVCMCVSHGLKCTELCQCANCENCDIDSENVTYSSGDSDISDDDENEKEDEEET